MNRQETIEQITKAARMPCPAIVQVGGLRHNGHIYRCGLPEGVKAEDCEHVSSYQYLSNDGSTYAPKPFATEQEARQHWTEGEDGKEASFCVELEKMDEERIASQAAYWLHTPEKSPKPVEDLQNTRARLRFSGPITSDDPQAAAKLRQKIGDLEQLQAVMKAANAAIRKHQGDQAAQIAAIVACNIHQDKAVELLKPDFCGRIGFADFELTNNNANIRRLKERLERVSEAQNTPPTEAEGSNARFEDCPSANRVRLFYPGKPSAEIRTRLKSHGFRWAPSMGCWQAYRNWSSIATAKREAGLPENTGETAEPGPDRFDMAVEDRMAEQCGL